jgi:hypothetical protein
MTRHLSIVKKPFLVWLLVAVVVLIGALVITFVPGRERVTLTLLQDRGWPQGAMLKLSNDTRKTITYLTAHGGSATLFVQRTADGWTNKPLPGDYPGIPWITPRRELKPGQSAEVYVELKLFRPPVRAGVVCWVPQGPLAQRVGRWVGWLKEQCHLKSREPGQIEVWCPESLQVSAKPTRAEGE